MKNEPVKSLERELKLEGGRGDTLTFCFQLPLFSSSFSTHSLTS